MANSAAFENGLEQHNDLMLDEVAERVALLQACLRKKPDAIAQGTLERLWALFHDVRCYNVEPDAFRKRLQEVWIRPVTQHDSCDEDASEIKHRKTLTDICARYLGYQFEFGPRFGSYECVKATVVHVDDRNVVLDDSDSWIGKRDYRDRSIIRIPRRKFLEYVDKQSVWVTKWPPTPEEIHALKLKEAEESIAHLEQSLLYDLENVLSLKRELQTLKNER